MNYRERITKAFLLRNKNFLFASQRVETPQFEAGMTKNGYLKIPGA
jgi:hypothetical protein